MDAARQYITAVMVRLADLIGVDTPYKISSLSFDENDDPPLINWAYGDITHDTPAKSGDIATEFQSLNVRIWCAGADQDASETATRALKNNLLVAVRLVALSSYTTLHSIGTFRWSEEAHEAFGRWLAGTITIPLPVANQVFEMATITRVVAGGYCSTPSDPDALTLIRTVEQPLPTP